MSKPKVLVTRKWPKEVEETLKSLYDVTLNENDVALSAAALKAGLQNYDAVLPTVTDQVTADMLRVENRRTKIIGNFGVGFNNIDIDAAREQGLVVTNTPISYLLYFYSDTLFYSRCLYRWHIYPYIIYFTLNIYICTILPVARWAFNIRTYLGHI